MASNARNLSKLLGTSTQVPTTALPPAIADLETVGQTLSGGEIAPSSIKSNTLTQSFDSNQAVTFNMADSIDAVSPIVSVFKEVSQPGVTSKGQWDVNANATNYQFFDEKPISYSSSTLTPSATGDGTFTSSNAVVSGYDISLISSGYIRQINATSSSGGTFNESAEYSSDGTKIYFSQRNSDIIKVFSLSTAYDITTIAGTSSSEYTLSVDAWSIRVNSAGTKMWVAYDASIEQFTLSTSHDVSTASSDGTWTIGTFIRDIRFNDDGTKIYIADINSDDIKQYSLTTAYDITGTKTLDGSITGLTNPTAILFNSDGSKLYYGQQNNSSVYVKNLGTLYDITTNVSSGTTVAWDSGANSGNYEPLDMSFNSDGTRLFILHSQSGSPYHKFLSEFTSGSSNAFNAADVGKKVVGNSGSAIITATSGTYKSVTAFADTSAISSWQLFGAQGKADGSGIELSGYSSGYDLSNVSYDSKEYVATQLSAPEGIAFKSDGTIMYLTGYGNGTVYQYTLSTAWDVSTASYANKSLSVASQNSAPRDIRFKTDGTIMYIVGSSAPDSVYQYTLSTAWDVSTASYANKSLNVSSQDTNPTGLALSPDGTKVYICGYSSKTIFQYNLSTAWDLSSGSYSNNSLSLVNDFNYDLNSISINSTGTKIYISNDASYTSNNMVAEYNLPSDGDISNLTHVTNHDFTGLVFTQNVLVGSTKLSGISFSRAGDKFYSVGNVVTDAVGGTEATVNQFSAGSSVYAYSQYSPALTNSSTGQINSSSWLDINSMTADETKNDGDIFYAVSTDNRTSWSVAKASDGVRKIARNNSGTWQYNNNAGTNNPWQYNGAAASGNTLTISSAFNYGSWSGNHINAIVKFSPDGTKIFWSPNDGSDGDDIYTANLSTAWDLSTATQGPVYTEYSSSGYGQASFAFNSDGTKLYTVVRASTGSASRSIRQWSLSTAYDVSTSSYVGQTPGIGNSQVIGLYVAPDESYFITSHHDTGRHYIKKWNLATAGNITSTLSGETAVDVTTYTNFTFPAVGVFWSTAPDFFDSGNKMVILNHGSGGSNTNDVYLIELSTAYDITSGTVIGKFTSATGANSCGVGVKPDGSKLYALNGTGEIVEFNTGAVNYETSETWVNGTTNNEHATLQQALTSQSFNRMNKAQLDAVADNYHFSQDSADTLDLMIAPYAASGTSPISDGVTINYDAEALIREAIPGTDYIAEFPNPTTLNITAVGAANLKIRAQ